MNSTHSQSFLGLYSDLFTLNLYLRRSRVPKQPEALYDRFVNLLASAEKKARDLGVSDVDIQDSKYALVALIDETMGWASRLEQEYFRKNIAGEEFFRKLDQIKESKGRERVLEFYYLSLTLGFEGRYFRNPGKLEEYIGVLRQILGMTDAGKLSQYGEIPGGDARRQSAGIPAWVPWVFTSVFLVAVGIILIILKVRMTGWATDVINRIQSFLS